MSCFFFLRKRRPPRSTLFPYTTLFRSSKPQFRNVGGNLYSVDAQGNLSPEPVITREPKKLSSKYGYNNQGKYVLKEIYDDGTVKEIDPGLRGPTRDNKGVPDNIFEYDPVKFNKTLNPIFNQINKIENLKGKYADAGILEQTKKKSIKNQINNIAGNEEQTLYSLMPKKTRAKVNDFYTELKGIAKKNKTDLDTITRFNQDALRKQFINKMVELKRNKKITDEELRVLSLWAKFKFGFLYGDQNAGTN